MGNTILPGVTRIAANSHNGVPSVHIQQNTSTTTAERFSWPRPHSQHFASRALDFYGDGFVAGKVSIEDIPARRRVRIADALTGIIVAEVWSAFDGRYRFTSLNAKRRYLVLAFDHEQQFNAVIADDVRPELPVVGA